MKKKFIVSLTFTKEVEEESCLHAISSAAFALRYGIEDPGSLRMEIVAELPIEESALQEPVTSEAPPIVGEKDIPF